MATKKFTAVNVTPSARNVLRRMAVTVSAHAGRRVSMSDALRVMDAVARLHPDEITEQTAALLGDEEEGGADT